MGQGPREVKRALQLAPENALLLTLTGAWLHERGGEAGLPAVFSCAFLNWSLAKLGEFAEGIVRGAEAALTPAGGC